MCCINTKQKKSAVLQGGGDYYTSVAWFLYTKESKAHWKYNV